MGDIKKVLIAILIGIMVIPFSIQGSFANEDLTDSHIPTYYEKINFVKYDGSSSTKLTSENDVIVLDNAESFTNISKLKTFLKQGVPVVSLYGSTPLKTISEGTWISTCFDDDAQCDALFYDVESSTTFCLSWDSPEELYSLVPDWLTSARDPNSNLRLFETDQISQSGIWGDWTVESRHVTESWGVFNVNNYYCSLIENNLDNNVFAAKHWVEVIPNSGKYTSDVEFKFEAYNYDLSRPDRIILDYAPTGSVGSSTYSVGLSASISDTGPSVGASISWSYTVDDITVHNYSNTANGLVDLVHEFTLRSDSSRETRCMSPGHTALSKTVGGVFNNGSYYGTDEFTVTFASSEKNLWEQIFGGSHWEYNTYSITLHPSILGNPKTITIHGNGGGYIDDDPEFHDYCEDYSWTFCQGTIVNLNYPEFFWGGHTLLGYSMHPVSGDIDYNVNDRLRISDSIELYCVWGD